ncbi:hypothetical protein RKD31_002717 [Streptomyces sp. SAI-163]
MRSPGPCAPGARTSHSFQTTPLSATSTSKRRSGHRGSVHCRASHSRSPIRRGATDSGAPRTERYREAAERDRGERSIACQRLFASRMSATDAPSSRRASSTGPGLWSAMRRSRTSWKSRGVNGVAGCFPVGMATIITRPLPRQTRYE